MNTISYYAARRDQREALSKAYPSGFVLVVSVENFEKNSKGGSICEVTADDAARLMLDQTHRVATDAEASAFRDQQAVARARICKDNLDRTREIFQRAMGRG